MINRRCMVLVGQTLCAPGLRSYRVVVRARKMSTGGDAHIMQSVHLVKVLWRRQEVSAYTDNLASSSMVYRFEVFFKIVFVSATIGSIV